MLNFQLLTFYFVEMDEMKKKIKGIISTVLVSVIIISTTLFFVLGANELPEPMELTKIEYQYKSETAGSGVNNNFYYSDYMLLEDANVFSADIAKASVATAVAAYGTGSNTTYINPLLKKMDFDEITNYNYNLDLSIYDNDHVAYSVAKKEINYNGEYYVIYCVPVKGTSGNAEWYSNFNLGTGDNHKGFYLAANEILETLYGEFNNDGYKAENRIIWVSGHSRGAAVANIVGGELSVSGKYAPTSNIFAYSYACPTVSKNADTTLTNIYYFNNPGDAIPTLPLEKWGYKCFGKEMKVDMTHWDNVCYQFDRITSKDFASLTSSKVYIDTIYPAINSSDVYNKPVVKLAVNLLGWYLGGKADTTIPELLEYCAVDYLKGSVKEQLSTASGMLSFLTGNYDIVAENDDGIKRAYQLILETQNMTEEEFAQWASSHSSELAAVGKLVGYTVDKYPILYQAYMDLNSVATDIKNISDFVPNLVMLFIDSSGNPLNAITHGHEQLTYATWINSLYYGTKGWYNSPVSATLSVGQNNSYIGDECFRNSAIAEITLNSKLRDIFPYTFYGCTNLKTVNFADGLEIIEEYAFSGCTGMTEIEVPDSVTTIGYHAFENTSLTKITLPFVGTSREATGNEAYFAYVFDYYSSYSGSKYAPETLKEVVITDATRIGSSAFYNCQYIEKVTINEGITTLGEYAFQYCYALKEINLPESMASTGEYAFYNCTSLTSIDLPENIVISQGAFYNCTGFKEINFLPDSLKSIGTYAFANCTGITKVEFSDSVETIEEYAFSGCTGMTEIEVPDTVTTIGYHAFENINPTKATLPFVGTSREATGNEAYFAYVFDYYSSYSGSKYAPETLKEVVVTDATQIGISAFYGCSNIEKITLNDGVKTIGNSAFSGCTGLKEINLPETLTSIGSSAFYNCTKLISDIVIPNGVTEIKDSTFSNCTSLTSVTLSENLKTIGNSAFYNCTGLTEIDVPNSVTSIGQNAFYKCDFLDVIKINSLNCSIYNSADTIPTLAVIYCCPGSTAQAYAEKYGRDFVAEHSFENGMCIYCNTSENLLFVESDKHIEGLIYELNTVTEFQLDMNLEGKYITVFDINGTQLSENDLVGTGATVYIYDSTTNELLSTYTVVLYGDVNGDGLIDDVDKEIITNVATCQATIENEWCLMAADTNHDGAVDGFDVIETDLQSLDMHNIEQVNNFAFIPKDEEDESKPSIDEEDPDGDGWWG